MTLYRIREWNKFFENNRSRTIESLRWVAFPNRHDGETFSLIMAHPDGAVIFSAWVLMVQLASKCTPRGSLLRGNGVPHDGTSMSAKCRCPDVWFKIALKYLIEHTDWLEAVEFTSGRQVGVIEASGGRQAPDEGGREGGNGIGWNGKDGSVERMLKIKTAVGKLYSYPMDQRWTYAEESGLVSICLHADVEKELTEILNYHTRMADKGFFPRSPATLFEKWSSTLYSARLVQTSKIPSEKELTPEETEARKKKLDEIYRKARENRV